MISPLAGKPAPPSMLVDVERLEREHYLRTPNVDDAAQPVSLGTTDHKRLVAPQLLR